MTIEFNITDGTTWTGATSADGSWNAVIVDGDTWVGRQSDSGATNIVVDTDDSGLFGPNHPSGAMRVIPEDSSTSGAVAGGESVGPLEEFQNLYTYSWPNSVYSAYTGMYYTNLVPDFDEGEDFTNQMSIREVVPGKAYFEWTLPEEDPVAAGVYGYNHIAIGNYDGNWSEEEITPRQLYTITDLTINSTVSITDEHSSALDEFWLTEEGHENDGTSVGSLAEIGLIRLFQTHALSFFESGATVGTYVDEGVTYEVKDCGVNAQGSKYYLCGRLDRGEIQGPFKWHKYFELLMNEGLPVGDGYINGIAMGVEPRYGNGTANVRVNSYTYTGAARAPWDIDHLTVSQLTSSSVQLNFNIPGATSYEYRIDGGSPVSGPVDKIVDELSAGTYDFEVRGTNAQGTSNWSNVASVELSSLPIQANYFTSQDLQNAFWGKDNCTAIDSNTLQETAATAQRGIYNGSIARSAGIKPMSFFIDVSNNDRRYVQLKVWGGQSFDSTNGFATAVYDLQEDTVLWSNIEVFTSASTSVEDMGAGVKRCRLSFSTIATGTGNTVQILFADDDSDMTDTGDTGKSVDFNNLWFYNTAAGEGGS